MPWFPPPPSGAVGAGGPSVRNLGCTVLLVIGNRVPVHTATTPYYLLLLLLLLLLPLLPPPRRLLQLLPLQNLGKFRVTLAEGLKQRSAWRSFYKLRQSVRDVEEALTFARGQQGGTASNPEASGFRVSCKRLALYMASERISENGRSLSFGA